MKKRAFLHPNRVLALLLKMLLAILLAFFLGSPTQIAPSLARQQTVVSLSGSFQQYLPAIQTKIPGLFVNPQNRAASAAFYHEVYLASEGVAHGWTGNVANCNAGTTTQAFKDAVVLRINYFRAMAGIPANVQLNATFNQKAQEAALMMSANGALSHTPPPDWLCYTDDGAQGAGSSNLYLGVTGPAAITGYMYDPGDGNFFVGHRRWILYPQTQEMGTGDLPGGNGHFASNALWVFDGNYGGPRPDTREPYVAWPPPGYLPYQLNIPRWSFAYPDADFNATTVVMTHQGNPVSLVVQPVVNGFGENTLVWEPDIPLGQPGADSVFSVQLNNVRIDGVPTSFSYEVIIFDPN